MKVTSGKFQYNWRLLKVDQAESSQITYIITTATNDNGREKTCLCLQRKITEILSIIIVLHHLIINKIYLTESVSVGVITYWICFTGWREELKVWVKIWNIYFVYKIYWETLLIHFLYRVLSRNRTIELWKDLQY